jgi:DNA-binding transcriptional LysR family regulator
MELRHLRYAVAVAEELHFGRAAARLHISQPPLSQQIRQLEDEIGTRLFRRTNRQVQLTEAGEAFVKEARAILAHSEFAARMARRASKGEIGQLTVGTVTSTDSGFFRIVVEILKVFASRYPDVRLILRSMNSEQQIRGLREGALDIGFLTLPVDDGELEIDWVRAEPLMLALPENHPLCKRKTIPLKMLGNERHVMYSRSMFPGYYDSIISACRKAGFSLNIVHEADAIYTMLALVAAGVGVSMIPASLQETARHGIEFRRITGALPQIEMGAAYRRDGSSNVLHSFLGIVRRITGSRRRYRERE